MGTLKPKTKQPVSAKVLNTWIAQAEGQLGDEGKGGRLGWLIASSVAIAAVQRALDEDGRQLFLLKGGTLLQHRLNATARTTKDVDGLIRGDMDAFFAVLENVLDEPWGPLTLRRGEVEVIDVPTKIIKPRRFDLVLDMRGVTWRRIQFEVSHQRGQPTRPTDPGVAADHPSPRPLGRRLRESRRLGQRRPIPRRSRRPGQRLDCRGRRLLTASPVLPNRCAPS